MENKIFCYAREFRQAIEKVNPNEIGDEAEWFRNFPLGCCGDASELLAKYLISKEILVKYNFGWSNSEGNKVKSHAWLVYQDYIIDITADQFDEISEKVIVTKDDKWHSKFMNRQYTSRDFSDFDSVQHKRLECLYKLIISQL